MGKRQILPQPEITMGMDILKPPFEKGGFRGISAA
jgi:hypothetical protein